MRATAVVPPPLSFVAASTNAKVNARVRLQGQPRLSAHRLCGCLDKPACSNKCVGTAGVVIKEREERLTIRVNSFAVQDREFDALVLDADDHKDLKLPTAPLSWERFLRRQALEHREALTAHVIGQW